MLPEENDVNAESSSALEAAIASSPEASEENQETQSPTAKQGVTQDKQQSTERIGFGDPRHPDHERFVELYEQNKWLKQQLEKQQTQFQQPQPAQPTTPQEIGDTPEAREFWSMQRKIAREEAEKVSKEHLGRISPILNAGREELAQIKLQQFRATHPDVVPDSPDETAIAERILRGYPLEDAYRSVMWNKNVAQKKSNDIINNKQKIEAKKQANVEQGSIPAGVNSHIDKKLTQRQRIEQQAIEAGI